MNELIWECLYAGVLIFLGYGLAQCIRVDFGGVFDFEWLKKRQSGIDGYAVEFRNEETGEWEEFDTARPRYEFRVSPANKEENPEESRPLFERAKVEKEEGFFQVDCGPSLEKIRNSTL